MLSRIAQREASAGFERPSKSDRVLYLVLGDIWVQFIVDELGEPVGFVQNASQPEREISAYAKTSEL